MSLMKAASALRCLRPLTVKTMAARMSSDHHQEVDMVALLKERKGTLNDLPVPQGSWQEDYNKRNSKYNLHLALSTGFLLFTIVFSFKSGAFNAHSIFDVKKIEIHP